MEMFEYQSFYTIIIIDIKVAVIDSNPVHFFRQIEQLSPPGLLAVHSMCALKKMPVLVHSPGSVNWVTKKAV